MPSLKQDESINPRKRLGGHAHWRSLNELAQTPQFAELMEREFPAVASEALDPVTRRGFLALMGASLALAGLAFSGCRWPQEKIAPYADQPEGFMPGKTMRFATAMELGGAAAGLLVTSYDGRPIKVEGNPRHPGSLGAVNAWQQASVLGLYDPDRSMAPVRQANGQSLRQTWDDFKAYAGPLFAALRAKGGAGLCFLGETATSPTLQRLVADLLRKYPAAEYYEYAPLNQDQVRLGAAKSFGAPHRVHYSLDAARVIAAFDEDFLLLHPNAVRYTRDYTQGRRPRDGRMSRLYVVESALSLTGAQADHRSALRPSEVPAALCALAAELTVKQGLALPADAAPVLEAWRGSAAPSGAAALIPKLAADLLAHRGAGLVCAGPQQPPEVHALCCLLNAALGNTGKTVNYTREQPPPPGRDLAGLSRKLAQGAVDTLVILGGNPAYDAPADAGFTAALAQAPNSIRLGLYHDETSHHCDWHIPQAHFLEAWGDARAWDGTLSVVQPLIAPLYDGMSAIELVAFAGGDELSGGYDLVRRTLAALKPGAGFELLWRKTLNDGVLEGSGLPFEQPAGRYLWLGEALKPFAAVRPGAGYELLFTADASVYDGRFANNGWLQELPDPLTKVTWDNAVLISIADADAARVRHGDVVELQLGAARLRAPAYVMPGQAAGCLSLALGYGRRNAGRVGDNIGADASPLRTLASPYGARGVALAGTGERHTLAEVQDHWAIDTVGLQERGRRVGELVRAANVGFFERHPDFAQQMSYVPPLKSLWTEQEFKGHRWGMAIDLNSCTGCGACIAACVAENNIPVVGKERVAQGREMHWMRVDRYFSGDPAAPKVVHQPLTCQHCENAPCEQVCPVAATVHSEEGLNEMVYNRCVGTRYCSNNCPYKVRRFNFFNYRKHLSETEKMQYNPEVTVRSRGVMEKCTFCVQRIEAVKITAGNERRPIKDGEIVPACAQTCPAQAITFGDLSDPHSAVRQLADDGRAYALLAELNVKPRASYLAKLRNPAPGTPEFAEQPELAAQHEAAAEGQSAAPAHGGAN
jgi:MoCo/4Fe-4S cofactor protein with predicted Tat translocation signal